jgi:hypothetical protein
MKKKPGSKRVSASSAASRDRAALARKEPSPLEASQEGIPSTSAPSLEKLAREMLLYDLRETRYIVKRRQTSPTPSLLTTILLLPESSDDQRTAAIQRQLEALATLRSPSDQTAIFLVLHSKIGPASIRRAFEVAKSIAEPHDRVIAMAALSPQLSSDQKSELLSEIARLNSTQPAAIALVLLLPFLEPQLRPQAFTILDSLIESIAMDGLGLSGLAVLSAIYVRHLVDRGRSLRQLLIDVGEMPDGKLRVLALRNTLVGLAEERFSTMIADHRSAIVTLMRSAPRAELIKWGELIAINQPTFVSDIPWEGGQGHEVIARINDIDLARQPPLGYIAPSGFEADVSTDQTTPTKRKKVANELPDKPPRLWVRRTRGRPAKGEGAEKLLEFISKVYGPYIPKFRNDLRGYIHRNDPALYTAIASFEALGGVLPPDLWLPTQRDMSDERLARAKRGELPVMTGPERRKVNRRLWRADKALKN